MSLVISQFLVQGEMVLDLVSDTFEEFNIRCVNLVQDDIKQTTLKDIIRNINVQIKFTDMNNKDILRNGEKMLKCVEHFESNKTENIVWRYLMQQINRQTKMLNIKRVP